MKKIFCSLILSVFSVFRVFAESGYLPSNIDLHGDLRARWVSEWGKEKTHDCKTEANMGCDYFFQDAWVAVKMKASTSNGKECLIFLDKAFLGYNIFDNEFGGLSLEVGRNKMDSMFDSKMQYASYFNGCHIIYRYVDPGFVDFRLHGGPHVVSSADNHYGWVAEAIWKEAVNTPLTLKYSFTDWNRPKNQLYKYAVSQITAELNTPRTKIYGAYLYNHQEDKYNDGFYIGFAAGGIEKAKDFLFDVNIQSTKSHVVSPLDFRGLKRGINVKILYALTSALCLESKFMLHDAVNNKKLELSAIYSW